MSLIIDANIATGVLPRLQSGVENSSRLNPDFTPVWEAISTQKARVVSGGKLRRELNKIQWIRDTLIHMDRQGTLHQINDESVDGEEARVKRMKLCKSDDEHVIALARVSNARLLCSLDEALGKDFLNQKLIDHPRGHVYKKASHRDLIRKHGR